MQNRLEAEGVVFSDLLLDIRHRPAQKYNRDDYIVKQIADLFGFSGLSVFRKVFKKWLSVAPQEYRESVQEFTLESGGVMGNENFRSH